jgi:hypothetical protein
MSNSVRSEWRWAVVAQREVKMMVDGGHGGISSSVAGVDFEADGFEPGPERSRLREPPPDEDGVEEGFGRLGLGRRRWRIDLGGLRRR